MEEMERESIFMSDMMIRIRIGGFRSCSTVDGPGLRSVLFFQGCSQHCPGCHNQHLQPEKGGYLLEISQIIPILESKCELKRLTISGGEPMEQYQGLLKLVTELKRQDFELCLYTSWQLADIPCELFEQLDYIKTGPYIEALRTTTTPFYGSTNQHFTELKKGA